MASLGPRPHPYVNWSGDWFPMVRRPALFLDRDGVIVEEVHYLTHPSQLSLIPGSAEPIALLNRNRVLVVVVTNQAGVARGLYSRSRIGEIHSRLDSLLAEHGAHIDRYYYCPHHPTKGLHPYRTACECRKPRPGMLLRAAAELHLDLSRSYMVGDRMSDLEAGSNAGCRPILVKTGYGGAVARSLGRDGLTPHYVADNLSEAVRFCISMLLTVSAWTKRLSGF